LVGLGAVGEELAAMVASTLGWFELDGTGARELGETIFEGYLAGLRDAVWTGDANLARLGYAIASARYATPFSGVWLVTNESQWGQVRDLWGRSIDELAHQWSLLTYFLVDMADEARELMK
jgi:hypothetical protein